MFLFWKRFSRKIKIAIVGTVLAASVGGGYQTGVIPGKKQPKLETAIVRLGDLKEELTLSGDIDAEEKITLRFQTSGKLVWVGVKQGDYVKKYQVLATLDQIALKKKLQKDLNDFLNERTDFDQQNDDYRGQALTDAMRRIVFKNQNDLNNTIIDVELSDLAIQYSRLSTPIEGILTKIDTPYAGVNITPAGAEFQVVNPASVYLSLTADQNDVIKLKNGIAGYLILDSYPDDKINGQIENISFSPKTGETSTVYQVKFKFDQPNTDYKYRLGMTGDVTFTVNQKDNVLYLPTEFVKGGKNSYVYIMKNNKKIKKTVTIGLETDDNIEIKSGLNKGDIVYD